MVNLNLSVSIITLSINGLISPFIGHTLSDGTKKHDYFKSEDLITRLEVKRHMILLGLIFVYGVW